MERIEVKKVEKTDDGGFSVVFQDGDNEHPVIFPKSFLKPDGGIDGERFLTWGAMKAPFDYDKLENPILAVADLMNQIEPMLEQ